MIRKYLGGISNWWHVCSRLVLYFSISLFGFCIRRPKISHWAMRMWATGSCKGLGIKRQIFNAHLLEEVPQCVLVSNHLSSLDIVVLGSYLQRDYRWLAKAPLFKSPFLGWHLWLSGHIPVYRGKKKHLNRFINDRIHEAVQTGASLLFFPEGTRSSNGQLKPFKIGAFQSAARENLPILPIVLQGTHDLMPKEDWALDIDQSHQCSATVLPPIHPKDIFPILNSDLSAEDKINRCAQKLRDICQQKIADAYNQKPAATNTNS